MTLAEITESSGLVKNKVFRLLYTLEQHALVSRTVDGEYRLGLLLMELGEAVRSQIDLVQASNAVMTRLRDETGETIFLGVRDGTEALCIATRESTHSVRLYAEVGRRAPLHLGGVPKTLFAHLPEDEINDVLRTIDDEIDKETLRDTLATVHRQGHVVILNELDDGAFSVAAPIRDHTETVTAAISIAGPLHRFDEKIENYYIELVKASAAEISEAMGYRIKAYFA